MTNHWIDIANSDRIMIIGSNAAENHPISFKWVMQAKDRGAKLISVDPRFTRTSSAADIYAPLRSGTDIAFIGGVINYALSNQKVHRAYVITHTNAGFLVDPAYKGPGDLDGLFSGYDPKKRAYGKSTWAFQRDENGIVKKDPTLKDPNCVYQLLKQHFARYDVDTVCKVTGTPKKTFLDVAETYCQSGQPGKSGTIMYAMGTTQHTHGTQNIRGYAILQLLLGNIGIAGGGINALRGESNVQGSTDHCLLFHILPGYLKCPTAGDQDLKQYLTHYTPKNADPRSANWWGNYPRYIVSLLKAWWGDHARKDAAGGFCFNYLPKRSADYSHISLFEAMYRGTIEGMIVLGQNPAVGGPNANKERAALDRLKWLIAVDLWETETAVFWKRPGIKADDIQTEVFLLPAASSLEKEGSITNSGRWAQWRYQAVEPVGEAKSDAWILDRLVKQLKKLYQAGGAFPDPIANLYWNYENLDDPGEPDPHIVAMEINGHQWKSNAERGHQIVSFSKLKTDGSTCSGNWLYCGSYVELTDETIKEGPHVRSANGRKLANRMAKRVREPLPGSPEYPKVCGEGRAVGLNLDWAWCWPVNRRILYNRASCDAQGRPYDPRRYVIKFVGEQSGGKYTSKKWIGDVPDGGWYPLENPDGTPREDGKYSFIMKPEGLAYAFSQDPADGPLPEHYEPLESPVPNQMSAQQINPAIVLWHEKAAAGNPVAITDELRKKFPIVATTYRISEHWQAGAMSRNLPWLVELVPDAFVELSKDLARRKGIEAGDRVIVSSARGQATVYALVTDRFKPFQIDGHKIDQVGLIWHFGYTGYDCELRRRRRQRDDTEMSTNVLTPHVGDANTMIPEFKAFLCDIRKKEA